MNKRALLPILALVAMVFAGCESGPPEAAKKTFTEKFPSASDTEWSQEDENVWEAEFEMDDKEYTACFSADGEWMETEWELGVEELPDTVVNVMAARYAGYGIDEVEWVDSPEFIGYELELEKEGDEDAGMEVLITPEGQVIKEEAEEEDEAGEED
jgi:hypothetical protein